MNKAVIKPMKPFIEHLTSNPDESFRYSLFKQPMFDFRWHVHPEFELTLITKGMGRRFIGDSINDYTEYDLVFIGSNLPHSWYSQVENQGVVIQFQQNFLGKAFLDLPELKSFKSFLEKSVHGLSFPQKIAKKISPHILDLQKFKALDRILVLLEVLKEMSESKYQILSSRLFESGTVEKNEKRIDKVCNYINEKYTNPITLKEISDIASMSPESFCRFFKSTTGKSFIDYVTELRIGKACMLLIESEKSISEICYDVGFNNISNFNRRFQKTKDRTPSQYRKDYLKNNN